MNILDAVKYVLSEIKDDYSEDENHTDIAITLSFINGEGMRDIRLFENIREE